MDKFNIELKLLDGSEIEVEVDVTSLGDLSQYSESEMDSELRQLVKEQYPQYGDKIVTIYC